MLSLKRVFTKGKCTWFFSTYLNCLGTFPAPSPRPSLSSPIWRHKPSKIYSKSHLAFSIFCPPVTLKRSFQTLKNHQKLHAMLADVVLVWESSETAADVLPKQSDHFYTLMLSFRVVKTCWSDHFKTGNISTNCTLCWLKFCSYGRAQRLPLTFCPNNPTTFAREKRAWIINSMACFRAELWEYARANDWRRSKQQQQS